MSAEVRQLCSSPSPTIYSSMKVTCLCLGFPTCKARISWASPAQVRELSLMAASPSPPANLSYSSPLGSPSPTLASPPAHATLKKELFPCPSSPLGLGALWGQEQALVLLG